MRTCFLLGGSFGTNVSAEAGRRRQEAKKMKIKSDIFRIWSVIHAALLPPLIRPASSLSLSRSSSPSRGLTRFLGLPRLPLLPLSLSFSALMEGKKEELITSLMEKGELCQDVEEGGKSFSIYSMGIIFRAAGWGRMGEEGRLTLTQISSVSLDGVFKDKIICSS